MRQDERAPFVEALATARLTAYVPGEFVGQESFMRASEILELARRAGIGPGVRVLDLCCGIAGPGRLVTRELGCTYLGIDYSDSAVAIAARLAGGLDCRFAAQRVPPVPEGTFDVVLLLETLLAFPDKSALLREIAAVLPAGGRFAFTLEEGVPLTPAERAAMPDADTVWLTQLSDMLDLLAVTGFDVTWRKDCSAAHHDMAEALIRAFEGNSETIRDQIGDRALTELLSAHRLWARWLDSGRVRKFAFVAQRRAAGSPPTASGSVEASD